MSPPPKKKHSPHPLQVKWMFHNAMSIDNMVIRGPVGMNAFFPTILQAMQV